MLRAVDEWENTREQCAKPDDKSLAQSSSLHDSHGPAADDLYWGGITNLQQVGMQVSTSVKKYIHALHNCSCEHDVQEYQHMIARSETCLKTRGDERAHTIVAKCANNFQTDHKSLP